MASVHDREQDESQTERNLTSLRAPQASRFEGTSNASSVVQKWPTEVQEDITLKEEVEEEIEEGDITMFEFLDLGLPKYKGKMGENLIMFLEAVEPVVRKKSCSDVRSIEMIGLLLKGEAWAWFENCVENQIHSEPLMTWKQFRQNLFERFYFPRKIKGQIQEEMRMEDIICENKLRQEQAELKRKIAELEQSQRGFPLDQQLTATMHKRVAMEQEVTEQENSPKRPKQQIFMRCYRCSKRHKGICRLVTGACLKCGQQGHYVRNCPISREPSQLPESQSTIKKGKSKGKKRWY